jgi:Flp pilus assembly protein TadD
MRSESETPFRAWIFLAWLCALITTWPLVKQYLRDRNPAPATDLAQSDLLFRRGQYAEAMAAAQRHLKRVPDSPEAWINIGVSYGAMGKWDEAINATHKAILLQPSDQLAWNNLRWMLKSQLDAHPTPEAYEDEALNAYQSGDFSTCATKAKKAVELYPRYAKAWNVIAACDLALGLFDDAAAAAREALRIEPSFGFAKNSLAAALRLKEGTATPASISPPQSGVPALVELIASSVARYRAKDMRGCIDDARKALELKSDLAVAYNNIAACSNDLGRYDDAIAAARQAIKLQPGFQLAINNLAVAIDRKKAQQRASK